MRVVPRQEYYAAKARHKLLWRCLYGFFFAVVFYGMLLGWSRTGNLPLYSRLIAAGVFAEDLLSPLIPAIDNVLRDYYADGYGRRALFARHVAAAGWLLGLAGGLVFLPLMWMDRKFMKRRKSVLRAKKRSLALWIFTCIAGVAAFAFCLWLLYLGDMYNSNERGGPASMINIRRYDLSAGGAIALPFGMLWLVLLCIIHAGYCLKTACCVWGVNKWKVKLMGG